MNGESFVFAQPWLLLLLLLGREPLVQLLPVQLREPAQHLLRRLRARDAAAEDLGTVRLQHVAVAEPVEVDALDHAGLLVAPGRG